MEPSGKSILNFFGVSGTINPVQMDQDDYQLIQFGGEVVDQTFTLNLGGCLTVVLFPFSSPDLLVLTWIFVESCPLCWRILKVCVAMCWLP